MTDHNRRHTDRKGDEERRSIWRRIEPITEIFGNWGIAAFCVLAYALAFVYADRPGCKTYRTTAGPVTHCITVVAKR